jgi:hypothetical protein
MVMIVNDEQREGGRLSLTLVFLNHQRSHQDIVCSRKKRMKKVGNCEKGQQIEDQKKICSNHFEIDWTMSERISRDPAPTNRERKDWVIK